MQMSDYKFEKRDHTYSPRVEVPLFTRITLPENGYTRSINHLDINEMDLALYT